MNEKFEIIRKFDCLGRIVIPKTVRETLFGKSDVDGLRMVISIENDRIILRPLENEITLK